MDRRKKQRRRLRNLLLRFEIGKQLRDRFPLADEIARFLSQNDSRRRSITPSFSTRPAPSSMAARRCALRPYG